MEPINNGCVTAMNLLLISSKDG